MNSTATANNKNRTAFILPASQLVNIANGTITSTYFKRLTASGTLNATTTFKIYLKNTSAIDFGSGSPDWATETVTATLVYDSNPDAAVGNSAGFKQFQHAANFVYTAGSNLAVYLEYVQTAAQAASIAWDYEYGSSCINTSNSNTTKYLNTSGAFGATLTSSNYRRPVIAFDATVPPPTTAPSCTTVSAPANNATAVSVTPTFTWAPAAITSSYTISVGTTPGGTNVMNNVDVGNVTTYAVPAASPLAYSTQYYLTVIPKNAIGSATGCTSTAFTTTTIPCPSVSAPASGAAGVSLTPTFTWTGAPQATGYRLRVGTTAGGTDVVNNLDLGNVTTYTLPTSLATSTKYYYSVSSYSASSNSATCTERNFTTVCGSVSAPFLETFSGGSLPACWSTSSTNNTGYALWLFGGTPDYGTTNNGAASGTYAWVDASSPYTGVHDVTLTSPQIDLAGLSTPYVQFKWFKNHLSTATGTTQPAYDNNQLTVQVKAINGTTWETVFTSSANSSLWRTEGVVLPSSYIGTTVQVRFVVDKDVAGNGYFYDNVLLDDVEIKNAPTCTAPVSPAITGTTNLTSEVSWTAPASAPANGYDIYYSTSSTAPTAASTPTATGVLATSYVINSNVSQGNTYYVWVRSRCSANDQSSWVGPVSFALMPSNEDCATAVSLTVNTDLSCGVTTAGTTLGATASNIPAGTCTGNPDDDVWYKFVATSTSHLVTLSNVISTGTSSSTSLYTQVFTGSCATPVSIKCGTTNSTSVTGLTIGETYLVRVYNSNGAGYSNSFNICVGTPPPPPSNDECAGATSLTVGGSFATAAVNATNAGATTNITSTCQPTNSANNIWFTVVIPASGNVTIETGAVSGSPFTDSLLAVYSGTCGSLTQISCNDDIASGSNLFSRVALTGRTPGEVIYVSVWRYNPTGTDGPVQVGAYDSSLLATGEISGAKNTIKVYPNPFVEVLNITDISNVKSVSVTDIAGRLVKTITNPSAALPLSELNSGLYLITLELKDGSKQTIKAIKK